MVLAINNYGVVGGRRMYVGPLIQGGDTSRIYLWIRDVGDETSHQQDDGRIPPQGGPPTDGE